MTNAAELVAHVDLRTATIGQLSPVRLPIVADVGAVLSGLADRERRPQVVAARIDHRETSPYGERLAVVHGQRSAA